VVEHALLLGQCQQLVQHGGQNVVDGFEAQELDPGALALAQRVLRGRVLPSGDASGLRPHHGLEVLDLRRANGVKRDVAKRGDQVVLKDLPFGDHTGVFVVDVMNAART